MRQPVRGPARQELAASVALGAAIAQTVLSATRSSAVVSTATGATGRIGHRRLGRLASCGTDLFRCTDRAVIAYESSSVTMRNAALATRARRIRGQQRDARQ